MKRDERTTIKAAGISAPEPGPGETDAREEERPPSALEHAVELPLDKIRRWRGQPRAWFDDEKLHELAESIRLRGVLQPIRVRPDRRPHLPPGGYVITVGERRFRAAQLAGLATIPALISDVDETQALLDALIENVQRQDLTPDEEHEAVQVLRERGLTDSEIARRLGVSKSTISRLVAVFDDATLGPRVADGRLSLTQARELLGVPEPDRAHLADYLLLRQREARAVGRAELRELVADTLRAHQSVPATGSPRHRATTATTRSAQPRPVPTPTSVIVLDDRATGGTLPASAGRSDPGIPGSLDLPVSLDDGTTLYAARRERDLARARARASELHRAVETTLAMLARERDDAEVQATLRACQELLTSALRPRG